MTFRFLNVAALACLGLGSGGAFASTCDSGLWQRTSSDMGTGSVSYAYDGLSYTQTDYALSGTPLSSSTLHNGYGGTDAVSATFTVQFDGARYCTSDITFSDGVFTVGESPSAWFRDPVYTINLAFDTVGNITDYYLQAYALGAPGDYHIVTASSLNGDSAEHAHLFLAAGFSFGYDNTLPETARASVAETGRLSVVPLPGTLPLAALGIVALGALRRTRKS